MKWRGIKASLKHIASISALISAHRNQRIYPCAQYMLQLMQAFGLYYHRKQVTLSVSNDSTSICQYLFTKNKGRILPSYGYTERGRNV